MKPCAVLVAVWFALASVLNNSAAPPPHYYDTATGKSGSALKQALHEIINDHTVIVYSGTTNDTGDALMVLDEDPANTNNVILLYAQRSEGKTNFGPSTGWNREHLWPNSYGLDDRPPSYTDLFNLRAEDASVNTARGNKIYDFSNPNDANYRAPANAEAAPGTSADSDSWEPPPNVRGDIARALFYMDVRYEGDRANELNLTLTDNLATVGASTNLMGRLSTLLLWNTHDPVDDGERSRNELIYSRYQHNRNPFIDHPEWVDLIFRPRLQIVNDSGTLFVVWPGEYTSSIVQGATDLTGPWTAIPGTAVMTSGNMVQEIPATNSFLFFRLSQ